MFIPFAGGVHLFDWDEINFAECAREMIVTGDYLNVQINFKPFWEKPPLFIWMQVLSMKTFGINEFAARFPNALCGMISLVLLFNIGRRLHSESFGLWWVLVYAGSILPHFYFRSGIIDPWFNLLIFSSLYCFFLMHTVASHDRKKRVMYASLWGVFTGLAILTKGPTALLIIGMVCGILYLPSVGKFFFSNKKWFNTSSFQLKTSDIVYFSVFAILIGSSWFIAQIFSGNADMVWKFIMYQIRLFTIPDAGHGGHWSYHFIVLLVGVFPASVFALQFVLKSVGENSNQKMFHLVMIVLFWIVLLLFTIVKTKIVHYSSLCYFPITYMAALAINKMVHNRIRWKMWQVILLLFLGSVFALLVAALPLIDNYKQLIISSGKVKDAFALANLQAEVSWTGFEWFAGLGLIAGIVGSVVLAGKQFTSAAFKTLFGTVAFFMVFVILVFPYRIEKYSQGAVIEFYKSKATEKCYVLNIGFFSYAPPFYANKSADDYKRPLELLTGHIDRPFYLVLKEPHYNKKKHLIPAMNLLYKKNGWVFLARYPNGVRIE